MGLVPPKRSPAISILYTTTSIETLKLSARGIEIEAILSDFQDPPSPCLQWLSRLVVVPAHDHWQCKNKPECTLTTP